MSFGGGTRFNPNLDIAFTVSDLRYRQEIQVLVDMSKEAHLYEITSCVFGWDEGEIKWKNMKVHMLAQEV